MGQVTITGGGPFGRYTVKNTGVIASIEGRLATVAMKRAELETRLPTARSSVGQYWDEVIAKRMGMNALVQQWIEGTLDDTIQDPPGEAEKQEVLDLVNAERAKNGIPPLTYNSQLDAAAQRQSDYIANTSNVSHTGANESTPADRMGEAGYEGGIRGENVAAGQKTPQEVFDAWMNSPPHRTAMLDPKYTEMGVGASEGGEYGTAWAQNFGAA